MAVPETEDDLWPIYILVVDDEPLLRMALAEELRDAGFTVAEAANADEALAYYHASQNIDLVFTDVQLPGSLDGIALVDRLYDLNGFLPVIVTSGALGDRHIADGAKFIPKPYRLDEARSLVFSTLGVKPRGAG